MLDVVDPEVVTRRELRREVQNRLQPARDVIAEDAESFDHVADGGHRRCDWISGREAGPMQGTNRGTLKSGRLVLALRRSARARA